MFWRKLPKPPVVKEEEEEKPRDKSPRYDHVGELKKDHDSLCLLVNELSRRLDAQEINIQNLMTRNTDAMEFMSKVELLLDSLDYAKVGKSHEHFSPPNPSTEQREKPSEPVSESVRKPNRYTLAKRESKLKYR
jgi:hypothetical protein